MFGLLRRLRVWPGMVFALIGANFCIVGVTVYASNRHRASFAVESEYDTKALHWESTARQLRRNRELGWSLAIESTESGRVEISLQDALGRPLESASITAEAFHHAHARSKVKVTLNPSRSGHYAANAAIDIPGLWEFRFTAVRGLDTFTTSLTSVVGQPGKRP